MPEGLIAAVIAAVLGISGAAIKRFGDVESRIDRVELNVANNYVTKADFQRYSDRIYTSLDRFEGKLDQHVQEGTQVHREILRFSQDHYRRD